MHNKAFGKGGETRVPKKKNKSFVSISLLQDNLRLLESKLLVKGNTATDWSLISKVMFTVLIVDALALIQLSISLPNSK